MHTWHIALLALTILIEARSQPALGQAMVAQVAINRAGPDLVEQTLFQPDQFTRWNPDTFAPGHGFRLCVLECYSIDAFPNDPGCVDRCLDARYPNWTARLRIQDQRAWLNIWTIAAAVYYADWAPPGELANCTHYDNPAFWPDGLPPWLVNCIQVGDHVFCD
jgi:hypothetical protein